MTTKQTNVLDCTEIVSFLQSYLKCCLFRTHIRSLSDTFFHHLFEKINCPISDTTGGCDCKDASTVETAVCRPGRPKADGGSGLLGPAGGAGRALQRFGSHYVWEQVINQEQ